MRTVDKVNTMQLSREDMLRELELVPMWHLRQPSTVPAATRAAGPAPQSVQSTDPVVDATLTSASTPSDDMSRMLAEQAVPASPAVPSAAEAAQLDLPKVAEGYATQEVPEVVAEVLAEAPPAIISPWLLYCPQADDADSQQLLQNMLKAMQLPEGQYAVVQQPTLLVHTRVQYAVLFGLQAANTFLGTHYAQLAEVRGQLHPHGETQVVITHHPRDMLAQPALKKEVWFDLCLLLARKA
ncbi:hypothetical protein [Methylophilus aquaticus]|uniref:Uncharacterized protein n=1 Tax=Methylophilus aquaticus TaxID=1971610 RepID=A0ABT9JQD8_9PROT|nr:hypothetical protein [Methylophilus aquaticus]MDP8566776.1 hypothetical protein [Methylophilus aquaticus]